MDRETQPQVPEGYYSGPRSELQAHVPEVVRRVLDVGCGTGAFGHALKQRGTPDGIAPTEVIGIELNEAAAREAGAQLDGVLVGDVEAMDLPFEAGRFDCIVFADLLEHLYDPVAVLRKAARILDPHGVMVMSIPNVRCHRVLEMLVAGRWKYEESGILDRTHIRFFTAVEMRNMVRAAGLRVLKMQPLAIDAPESFPRNADGSVVLRSLCLTPRNDRDYLDLLTFQYVVVAGLPRRGSACPEEDGP